MIYFAQVGDEGPIKIGKAINPAKRLIELQVSHYETIMLLGVMEGDRDVEVQLLEQFKLYRKRGEGCEPEEDLVQFIRQNARPIKKQGRKPSNRWARYSQGPGCYMVKFVQLVETELTQEDLIPFAEAARALGWSVQQLVHAVNRGEFSDVVSPQGRPKSSLRRYAIREEIQEAAARRVKGKHWNAA